VLSVARSGDDMPVITSGTPTVNQVKFTSGTGQLEFAYALGVDEWITVVYVS
jgi:hypothetical protein